MTERASYTVSVCCGNCRDNFTIIAIVVPLGETVTYALQARTFRPAPISLDEACGYCGVKAGYVQVSR